jgi:hypothetical protein
MFGKATVNALAGEVRGAHMAAIVRAVHFDFAADLVAVNLILHRSWLPIMGSPQRSPSKQDLGRASAAVNLES